MNCEQAYAQLADGAIAAVILLLAAWLVLSYGHIVGGQPPKK